ncbi:odorant-binding protein 59a [Drosophila rhopaloa]|uniref:General odorant-binding protein 71 n=2 Tax=Drosophila rhopaloa TaxID=1041015 RepID=A0ABM5I854_DRORH|nr:odorant-binding protein 59a [Drosophila rhopaloa]
MRLLILLLIGLGCCSCCTSALKCRSQEGLAEAELKRTVRGCMRRQDDNEDRGRGGQGRQGNGHGFEYERDQEEEPDRDPDRNMRNRGGYGNRRTRGFRQSENRNNTGGDGGQCVAQCFFEEMNMVDGNGMPDRRKVSYLLTKDLRDRELRNFFTDTVQQCFRYLENIGRNRHNKCAVARELVKCMSEYAKAQCEDWEEHGNMLFN